VTDRAASIADAAQMTIRRFLDAIVIRARVVALAASVVGGYAPVAGAQPPPPQELVSSNAQRPYDLPVQPLGQAVLRFAEQAGVQVVFDGRSIGSRAGGAVEGHFTIRQALDLLLADTGYHWHAIGPQTVTIDTAPAPLLEHLLDPIHIEGRRDKATTITTRGDWDQEVLTRLERNKRYPAQAQGAGLQDVVYVHIIVDRSGRLLAAAVTRSKHFSLLDRAALDLVKRAAPLPPLPDDIQGEQLNLTVPVDFFLNPRATGCDGQAC
jgi:TonB family protein